MRHKYILMIISLIFISSLVSILSLNRFIKDILTIIVLSVSSIFIFLNGISNVTRKKDMQLFNSTQFNWLLIILNFIRVGLPSSRVYGGYQNKKSNTLNPILGGIIQIVFGIIFAAVVFFIVKDYF